MSNELNGKIALVTGAASGIGRAAALAFSQAGATVVVSDVSEDEGRLVANQIVATGGEARFIRCNVQERDEIEFLMANAVEIYGRIDCTFNNAGKGGLILPLAEYPEDEWDDVIQTNLKSIFLCMKFQIVQMLRQGVGSIVNCASVSGMTGTPGMPAYCASKFGIMGLTRVAARDYATRGIRINAVCPGTIHTPAVDAFLQREPELAIRFIDNMRTRHPIGRLGTPEEVASAVVWLSSPGASFMTGHGLVVDGGRMA